MITSIRPILVDHLQTVDSIKCLVGDRITDIDYNFEDLYSAQANDFVFPAISIESVGLDPTYATNCIVNQYTESLNLTLLNQVSTQGLRAKSKSVRANAVKKLRELDTLKEAVLNYLTALTGNLDYLVDIHMVRILSASDSVFSTENKSKIYQIQISLNITYSKGVI